MTAPRHGAEGGEKGAALTEERDDELGVPVRRGVASLHRTT